MHTKAWMLSSTAVSQILFLLAFSPTACAQEWRFYGGDPGGTRSSPLKQINRQNVGSLKRAWTYHMGEVDRGGNETDRHHVAPFESTPIVIDGVLYFSTPSNRVIALAMRKAVKRYGSLIRRPDARDRGSSSSTVGLPTGRARQETTVEFCTVLSTGA